MKCALFAAYPDLEGMPFHSLGRFPTPIQRVRGLLPSHIELWVKREDLSGTLYGGNKVRKLEFLLAAAARSRFVLTAGGYGSHHVLATTLYGKQAGLGVEAVIFPQPPSVHARNTLGCALAAGVRLWAAKSYWDLPLQALRALRSARRQGGVVVAPGGSSPLGTLGWVSGGLEIAGQVRTGEAPPFDVVYAPLGSAGTVSGLWLGLGPAAARLVGVRVVPWAVGSRSMVELLAWRTRRLLLRDRPRPLPEQPELHVDGRWVGEGYGHVTMAAVDAVQRAASVGLRLETTYSGKAMAALIGDARAGLLTGKRVLFLHTFSSVSLSGLLELAPQWQTQPEPVRRWAAAPLAQAGE